MSNLPSNWVATTLGSFCDLVNGRAFRPSEWSETGLPIIRIQNLRNPDASHNRFDGTLDERHVVRNGDLLFAWSGTPGTSFGAHIWSGGTAVLNQHIFKVVFDNRIADPQFLKLAINANLPALVKQAKGGAGLKHLTRSVVEEMIVPLPPRPEQSRIMSALAQTAGRLITVETELDVLARNAPAVERQILAAAVAGTLTIVAAKPSSEMMSSDEVWETLRIEDVGEILIGRQRSPKHHQGPFMRPYLRVANVLDDRIDISDVMSMNFDDAEFDRYRLEPGDILLNEGQSLELVGRAAMFRGELQDACFTNTLIRFRAGPRVHPEYALIVFRAYQHIGRFREIARITTNLAHLGTRRFAQLEFPLPPLDQQRSIVQVTRGLINRVRSSVGALAALRIDAQRLIGSMEAEALTGGLSEQRASEAKPALVMREKRRRAASPRDDARPASTRTVQGRTDMPTMSIVQALIQSGAALNAQDLFAAAGYPEDASVLQVEQFFMDLRRALAEGRVQRTTADDERFVAVGADR